MWAFLYMSEKNINHGCKCFKKRLTCKETHENDPDEGDDASSDQGKANHPVGVFQVAAFHLIISENMIISKPEDPLTKLSHSQETTESVKALLQVFLQWKIVLPIRVLLWLQDKSVFYVASIITPTSVSFFSRKCKGEEEGQKINWWGHLNVALNCM